MNVSAARKKRAKMRYDAHCQSVSANTLPPGLVFHDNTRVTQMSKKILHKLSAADEKSNPGRLYL